MIAVVAASLLSAALAFPVAPPSVGPSPDFNTDPMIVSDGGGFLVFWRRSRIEFARVTATGEIATGGEVGDNELLSGAVEANGKTIVSLWSGQGTRLASIDGQNRVQFFGPLISDYATIAWNGTLLLIAGFSGNAMLMDDDGHVVRSGIRIAVNDLTLFALAPRPNGFVAAWVEGGVLYTAFITNSGDVSVPIRIAVARGGPPGMACSTDGACLIVFQDVSELRGVMLRGASIDAPFSLASDIAAYPIAPVWDGTRFLVVHTSRSAPIAESAVRLIAVGPDGSVGTPAIFGSRADHYAPAVGVAGGRVVVGWIETLHCVSAGGEVVLHFVAENRDVLLTRGSAAQGVPAIASTASSTLTLWSELSDVKRIRGRLFPADGALDVSAGPGSTLPAAATDGNRYLVAWVENNGGPSCDAAIGFSLLGSGNAVTIGTRVQATRPVVAWNGSNFGVAWETHDPTQIVAIRVDLSGALIDSVPVPLTLPETGSTYVSLRHLPRALLWNGSRYLLVWERTKVSFIPFHPDPPPEMEVRAQTVEANLKTTLWHALAPNAHAAVAAINGRSIVALWTGVGGVHGAQLTPDGAVISDRVVLPNAEGNASAITATRPGYAAIAGKQIVYLADDGTLAGHEPDALPGGSAALTSSGDTLTAVYEDGGLIYLWTTPARPRRRSSR